MKQSDRKHTLFRKTKRGEEREEKREETGGEKNRAEEGSFSRKLEREMKIKNTKIVSASVERR